MGSRNIIARRQQGSIGLDVEYSPDTSMNVLVGRILSTIGSDADEDS